VALLGLLPPAAGASFLKALSDGLREHGYVEGRNLVLQAHTADGNPARLPELAAQVVRLNFDVIVTTNNETTGAAKQATTSVPIVMAMSGNPARAGLIASIARPGGNITGLTFDAAPEAYSKPLEFLKEISPKLSRIAVLRSTRPLWEPMWVSARDAAGKMRIELQPVDLRTVEDIAPAFSLMKQQGIRAFLFWPDPVSYAARGQIAELALKEGLLSGSLVGQYADSGGLLAYGPNLSDLFRRSAVYVDKILKGAKPADLPVEQPSKFELVINLKTAKALGLTIPQSLLIRTDRVIE
jgi:putative ABC transport system substrate-binding protein